MTDRIDLAAGGAATEGAGIDERLAVARWLHDRVVPLVTTAGLRVELAAIDATPDQLEHLGAASAALAELGSRIRDEMARVSSE